MKHLDLFSGIGGFSIASDMVWDKVQHVFCDNDLFCQEVLKKHWPTTKIYSDITEVQNEKADLVTGGFPCQPFSLAGKRRGVKDARHVWPQMLRVIREAKPTWVVGENVAGIISMELEQVCLDLEAEGYEVQPLVIPACAVNAPHRRDRVWIIGYSQHNGRNGAKDKESSHSRNDRDSKRQKQVRKPKRANSLRNQAGAWERDWHEVAAELCRVDDGVSKRLDRDRRIKALGNAIVPQVAIEIFEAIKETI